MANEDTELSTLAAVAQQLDALPLEGRRRVLGYLDDRYGRGRCAHTWESSGPAWRFLFQCVLAHGHEGTHVSAEGRRTPEVDNEL